MRLRVFGATDKGLVRANNQDAFFCSAEYGIVIVSDGMGGHKGGELASQLVVEGLRDAYLATSQILVDNVGPFLDEVLKKINSDILKRASEDEKYKGMGATVNYLQFAGGYVSIGHAGDSRTYLSRVSRRKDNKKLYSIWPLTIDHNVGTFVERGLLVPGRDLPKTPLTEAQKARLMRGMGVVSDLKADLYCRKLEEGDVYVTCSDGLHGFVSDRDILEALASGPIAKAHERLIKLALSVGAPDNVTVVVSVVSDADEPLLECTGPIQDRAMYLVRLPGGEIRGTMSAEEILDGLVKCDLSGDTEICGSLKKWIFLERRDELFRHYAEFDNSVVRSHYARMVPSSLHEPVREKPARLAKPSTSFVAILGFLICVLVGLGLFFMLQSQ